MEGSHNNYIAGGSSKKREREEQDDMGQTNVQKRPRRAEKRQLDMGHFHDCINLRSRCIEIHTAMEQTISYVLDGGATVQLGNVITYPGWNENVKQKLMGELKRALEWRLSVGFVPFFYKAMNETELDANPTNDSMDVDGTDSRANPNALGPEDLNFIVPEVGYGNYIVYLDTEHYMTKVDYVPTAEEKDTVGMQWFVFTEERPTNVMLNSPQGDAYEVRVRVNSSLARLLHHANVLERFRREDVEANELATNPVILVQHRPPEKATQMSMITERQAALDMAEGRNPTQAVMGYPPHAIRLAFRNQRASTFGPEAVPHPKVDALQRRILYIHEDYQYVGLATPHAYTRESERHLEFLTNVSIEFGIPSNVLLPGRTIAASMSGGMTGSAAGGKKQQATGSHTSSVLKERGANSTAANKSGSSFSADPVFLKALSLRDFLQNFFRGVMSAIAGDKLKRYVDSEMIKQQREMVLNKTLADEIDEKIRKAQDAVINFGHEIALEREAQNVVHQNEIKQAVIDSKVEQPLPSSSTGGDGNGAGHQNRSEPRMPLPDKLNVPVTPEVQELTRRRLQIANDMHSISEAIEKLQNMRDGHSVISLRWRQPFVNDTGSILNVIEQLGLTAEEGIAIAQRRYGLNT